MKYKVIGWTFSENYDIKSVPLTFAARHAIIDEIKAHGYLFSGYDHQEAWYGCPVLNDGKKRMCSQRGFAGIMAEAHNDTGLYAYSRYMFGIPQEIMITPKPKVNLQEISEARNLCENFSLKVSEEQYAHLLSEGMLTLEDLPTLRYIDAFDTVTITYGAGNTTFEVLGVDRHKDLPNEDCLEIAMPKFDIDGIQKQERKMHEAKTLLKIKLKPYEKQLQWRLNMKKILSLILTLCMCLTMGTVLTACDFGTTDPGHTHTYETVWSHNDTYHWYACEDKTCVETSQKAEHSIENGVCFVCGHEQSNPTPQPTPSANEVTEEQFNAAFAFEGIASVTVQSESNTNIVNGVQQEVSYATIYLQDNKLKCVSGDITTYNEVYDTYAYGYSYDTENEKWLRIKIENTDDDFSNLMTFASIKEMFEEVDFSDFVYADGYYTGSQVFEEGTQDEYTVVFKFQFENGKLISARGEYEIEGFDCYDYLSFSAYNETNVTLPADYEEVGSVTPTPDLTTAWSSYFVFDNVTVTKASSTYYPDYDITISETETIKVQDDRWLLQKADYYYNEVSWDNFPIYFDGANAYVNGSIDNDYDHYGSLCLDFTFIANNESVFVETSTGIFEAEEIQFYGTTYSEIKVEIVENEVVSIGYKFEVASDYANYSGEESYVLSDYDNTTIDEIIYTTPSEWVACFDFDNVTVTQTAVFTTESGVLISPLTTIWKFDDEKWISSHERHAVSDSPDGTSGWDIVETDIAYFDGTLSYLNNEQVDALWEYECYILDTLAGNENTFTKVMNGNTTTYTAMEIEGSQYTNVSIIVVDGKITQITYTLENGYQDINGYHPTTYTLTFTAYGTTVIE